MGRNVFAEDGNTVGASGSSLPPGDRNLKSKTDESMADSRVDDVPSIRDDEERLLPLQHGKKCVI